MPAPEHVLRLDQLTNPFAPPPAVRALAPGSVDEGRLPEKLTGTIAARLGLPPHLVVLGRSADDLVRSMGTESSQVLSSPNIDTGKLLTVTESIRAARSTTHLVIDERAGGFSLRDHLPQFREFEHISLIRWFDPWIEPAGGRVSYLLTKQEPHSPVALPDVYSMQVALAAMADDVWMEAAIRRTAKERVRLGRALRKLNMVRPLPSAAGFVSARIERGDREALRSFLAERRIVLHYPESDGASDLIRVTAVSAAATSTLCRALIEWALTLD